MITRIGATETVHHGEGGVVVTHPVGGTCSYCGAAFPAAPPFEADLGMEVQRDG